MSEAGWRLQDVLGVTLLRCSAIEAIPGVAHAFSTRRAPGGVPFDLGRGEDLDADVLARRRLFLGVAGLGSARAAVLRQVHGRRIVGTEDWPESPPPADGVLRVIGRDGAGPVPAVFTADCVPVLMVDRKAAAVAAVHAGWRGIAAGIGAAAVRRFADEGVPAHDLVVALGPSIGPCCYEVGGEVVDALLSIRGDARAHAARGPSAGARVDLHSELTLQLQAAGVPERSIHASPLCTRCRSDLFFSHRGEGPAAGRLMAAIGPAGGP